VPTPADLNLTVALPADQLDALAARVAELLEAGRDDGFLDADGAAEFLGLTRKALYHLLERRRLPHHRPAGRLLFDRAALRAWVESGR
jgi:excisionase family DNA binding protein